MKKNIGATGPRTARGKKASSRNALTHGIFAGIVIPGHESRADFELLCQGLSENLRPQSMIEHEKVEQLAMLMWRYRRLAIVERATIQEELGASENERLRLEAIKLERQIERGEFEGSLAWMAFETNNPFLLDRAIECGETFLKTFIERSGPLKWDSIFFRKVFLVPRFEGASTSSQAIYEKLIKPDSQQPDQKGREENELDKEASEEFVKPLKEQIMLLEIAKKHLRDKLNEKRKFRLDRALLPPAETVELLMRYETHLSRQFDRTLDQLARLQRIRLGHPEPPSVKVEVTGE